MIISVFDTIFSSCKPAGFAYRSGKLWELNQPDGIVEDEVLWALPFEEDNKYTTAGLKITTLTVQILFLRNNLLSDGRTVRTGIVDAMHTAMNTFVSNFRALSISPDVKRFRCTDVYDDFDANRSGVSMWMTFEFTNTIC